MPNTTLTRENIKKRVRRRLGEGVVAVELQAESLDEAIETTLDYYNQVRAKVMHSGLAVSPTMKEYNLQTIGGFTNILGVVHVSFITRPSSVSQVDPFDPFDSVLSTVTLGGETYGEVAQRLAYTEDAARIADAEPEWEFWWDDAEQPILYVDVIQVNTRASVEWRQRYPFTDAGMQKIPHGDVAWFIDYATEQSKLMLGRSLRKFQGVTNPDGSQDPLDGAELVSEATEAIRLLEERMEKRRPPLGPVTE